MKPLLALVPLVAVALAGCVDQASPSPTGLPEVPAVGEVLAFGPRVSFPNPVFPVQLGTTCLEKGDGDLGCGLDEPSVVVDAQGRVFYTAACCFFVSSPVFVSEDGGESFRELAHPLKDFYGNEGDLAVDAAGNLYYMDIDLLTFGFARWTPGLEPAEGKRHPGELLVDRPWVRATQDGVVMAIYNTGSDTIAYRSTDHGLTFTLQPVARFGSALAGAYSDTRHGIVGMYGGGAYMESLDDGATWGPRTPVEGCDADPSTYALEGAAVDEAGTVWHLRRGCVVGRTLEGAWTPSTRALPEGLDLAYTWIAAGAAGGVAVAAYGQASDPAVAEHLGVEPDAWHLVLAWSPDAGAAEPQWTLQLADPEPVASGTRDQLGRRLGDFLMVAIGPDGAVHVAYAVNQEMDDSATASYVRSPPVAALAPSQPLVGPFSAEGAPPAPGRSNGSQQPLSAPAR